jgi:hypothetical protein
MQILHLSTNDQRLSKGTHKKPSAKIRTSENFFLIPICSFQSVGKGKEKMMIPTAKLIIADERYGACAVVHNPPGMVLSQLNAIGLQVRRLKTTLVTQYPKTRKMTPCDASRNLLLVWKLTI